MVFHLTTIYYCIAAAAPGVWLHKEGRVLLFFFFFPCLVPFPVLLFHVFYYYDYYYYYYYYHYYYYYSKIQKSGLLSRLSLFFL